MQTIVLNEEIWRQRSLKIQFNQDKSFYLKKKCHEEKNGCNLSSPWKRKWSSIIRHLLLYDTLCFFTLRIIIFYGVIWVIIINICPLPFINEKTPPPPPVNYREGTHTAPQRQGIVSTIQLTRQHVYTHKKSIYTHRYGNTRVWHPVYMCFILGVYI